MISHTLQYTVPAGYALLPPQMESKRATAMVLAIGLQESLFRERRQIHGPAKSFYQFERSGVRGVLTHRSTKAHVEAALRTLRYQDVIGNASDCHDILEHNDTLAFIFARLLLWTLPDALPARDEADLAWRQYLTAWRPGRPHPETWNAYFAMAWEHVEPTINGEAA